MFLFLLFQLLVEFFIFFCIHIILFLISFKIFSEGFTKRCTCRTRLDGKVALVTGGSSGVGLETAKDLARRGAKVIITCIREETAKAGAEVIIAATGNQDVHYRVVDFRRLSDVKTFAEDILKSFDRLNILVNNAGVTGIPQVMTEDGIETIMQINYVAPFLLTDLLKERLIASKPSRIVGVTSVGQFYSRLDLDDLANKKSLSYWKRYANSKMCMVSWLRELSRRLPAGVTTYAAYPGVVKTPIYENKRTPQVLNRLLMFFVGIIFKLPVDGAQTSIHACVYPNPENVSGQYYAECEVQPPPPLVNDPDFTRKVYEKTSALISDAMSGNNKKIS